MKLEAQFNQDKNSLRRYFKDKRKSLINKSEKDNSILENLISIKEYINADIIFSYVSLENEISTDNLIEYSLSIGKKVAVPYCIDEKGNMDFYYINCLDDLLVQSFGIREPNIDICKKVVDFSNSVIILPGLCFDKNGNRLGYGKGYYDRFLQNHNILSLGLCYNDFIVDTLPSNEYDKKVDIIVTDKKVIRFNGGKNG